MANPKHTADERFARFKEHLRAQRLKSTAQRDTIVKAFLSTPRHVSVEELYTDVRRRHPHIGYATVYRTMKLLTECGVAAERHFRDGEARYESAEKRHHDHLICESCGKIVEFEEPRIERLQEETARRLDFHFTGHKMELYGVCRDCRKARHSEGTAPAHSKTA
jgi:Fur family ferric uptake transcriptional regulator